MEQTGYFLHIDQTAGNAVQSLTKSKGAGNQESPEYSLFQKPFTGLSVFPLQPKERILTPSETSEFAYLSHLSFNENKQIPDKLPSFQGTIQEDQNNYRLSGTPHHILEYHTHSLISLMS